MKKTIVVRHKVGNFDTWMNGHQDRLAIFNPAISRMDTFQDADNPNSICLVMDVTDMDKFQSILQDPSTQKFKDKHTVLEPITVSMQVEP